MQVAGLIVDLAVVPGLSVLAAEFIVLAAVGYVVTRTVLRQPDERVALAQGLVVGLAIWGLIVNFVLYVVPGLAGAVVGWVFIVTLGTVLAWRSPQSIWPRPRMVAGFAAAVLALFWAALASRQLMLIPDPPIHLGLAATFRAGGFPPELPWNAGTLVRYHHATDLLVGLLAPPVGPDLAFVSEVLGAYAWMSFVLIVVSALLQRSSLLSVLVLSPLMLSSGLWTFTSVGAGVLQVAVPTGLPEAGLRASLGEIYWPQVALSPDARLQETLADIWKPGFPLSYALAFVVLQYAARDHRWFGPQDMAMAGFIGFLGLLSTTLVPVVLIVWAGLAALRVMRAWRNGSTARATLWLGGGPVLAALLLLGGGGAFTGILDGAPPSGLTLTEGLESKHWQALGSFNNRSGGVGVLGLGPLALAAIALAVAWRERLVTALAASACLLVLAWLALDYQPAPWDLNRLAGHARNLGLVALLLALSTRLVELHPRWRLTAGALLMSLIVWPTVVSPARSLGHAIGHGVQVANARWVQLELLDRGVAVPMRRFQLRAMSDRVADYIRNHTAMDARVLATVWPYWNVFLATGRPNNAGFTDVIYLIYHPGPEFWDARHYLEPEAIRRLGLQYVHATDVWVASLPPRAQAWLADPNLFEFLIRDGDEALYRVRRSFLELKVAPHPESFEALRAVPPATAVYLAPQALWLEKLRVASALSHARLVGSISSLSLHRRTPEPWSVEPLGELVPDLVVLPSSVEPWTWMFPSRARRPVWQNSEIAIYAPDGALAAITPPKTTAQPPPVTTQVSDVRLNDGSISFTIDYDEHEPDRWSGQDWVIIEVDDGPWEMPAAFLEDGRGPKIAKWFAGLISPGSTAGPHSYELEISTAALAVRNDVGDLVKLESSDGQLNAGKWILAMRIQHEWQPNHWREAAFIPVIRFAVSKDREISLDYVENVLARWPTR